MELKLHHEPRETNWLFRVALPACAWAMVFAFFAAAGWVSLHDPAITVNGDFAEPTIADTAAQLARSPDAATMPGAEAVPPAVTARAP